VIRVHLGVGEQHRLGQIVSNASRVEVSDLRIHTVALSDAGEPRPRIECLGVGARLPQIDAAGPAVLGVNKLFADKPWHRAKTRRDLAKMLDAGLVVDVWRKAILDDRGDAMS